MPAKTRNAYICQHRDCVPPRRLFLDARPSTPPSCPDGHGRMARQSNKPYRKPRPDGPARPQVVEMPGRKSGGRRARAGS